MPLSPEDIETRQFTRAPDGYDRSEVDSFLRVVATDYRLVLMRAPGQAPESGEDAVPSHEVTSVLRVISESVRTTAERAERDAADLRRAAEDEAASMRAAAQVVREDAEQRAAELRDSTRREARELLEGARQEAEALVEHGLAQHDRVQAARLTLRRRLQSMTEAVMELLREELETDEVLSGPSEDLGQAPGGAASSTSAPGSHGT